MLVGAPFPCVDGISLYVNSILPLPAFVTTLGSYLSAFAFGGRYFAYFAFSVFSNEGRQRSCSQWLRGGQLGEVEGGWSAHGGSSNGRSITALTQGQLCKVCLSFWCFMPWTIWAQTIWNGPREKNLLPPRQQVQQELLNSLVLLKGQLEVSNTTRTENTKQ